MCKVVTTDQINQWKVINKADQVNPTNDNVFKDLQNRIDAHNQNLQTKIENNNQLLFTTFTNAINALGSTSPTPSAPKSALSTCVLKPHTIKTDSATITRVDIDAKSFFSNVKVKLYASNPFLS